MKISRSRSLVLFSGATLATALVLTACGGGTTSSSDQREETQADTSQATEVEQRTLTVFAAASLGPIFSELALTFEAEHPGVAVVFNFAGSQALQEQILEGAQADVFASANELQMQPVVDAELTLGTPTIFATNQLTIVTPPNNPADVQTFDDLAADEVTLVICAPDVPCGSATQKVAEAVGVVLKPVSEEQAVTDVLAKIQLDEADAGLVYKTDAITAAGTVEQIDFAESEAAINRNPIVALSTGEHPDLGQAWVDFILSGPVQELLKNAGFGPAVS